MSEEQYQGKWNEIKGNIRRTWGKLTDDEVEQSKGNLQQLAGKIQEKYGETKENAAKKLNELFDQSKSSDTGQRH